MSKLTINEISYKTKSCKFEDLQGNTFFQFRGSLYYKRTKDSKKCICFEEKFQELYKVDIGTVVFIVDQVDINYKLVE